MSAVRSLHWVLHAIVIGTICCFAAGWLAQPAHASSSSSSQEKSSPAKTKEKKKAKKNKQERDKAEQEQAPPDSDEESGNPPEKHPTWKVGRNLTLELTARVEGDLRGATTAIGLDSTDPAWQDRRLGFRGTAFKRIEFEVSRELGDDFETAHDLSVKTPWRDAYADVKVAKAFNVKAGRFKLPFGHEELTGESNRDFTYRSLAARVLSPGRDPGVMAHGRLFKRVVEYQIGYFTRDGTNLRTSQIRGGEDATVVRVVLRPFASTSIAALAPFEVGVAVADSHVDNRLGIRGRTVLGDGVFFDRVYVNGRRERRGWEGAWALGPVGVSAEHITASDQRQGMGFSGTDLPNVNTTGWYVAGTWTVTGERKHGWVEPRRPLTGRGFGAVEVAARVETLRFDRITFPTTDFGFLEVDKLTGNADHATTFGVNWYLNHNVKLMMNVIREQIDDPQRSPAPLTGGRFLSSVFRIQVRL